MERREGKTRAQQVTGRNSLTSMLTTAVNKLDALIVDDKRNGPELFERLLIAQHDLGLLQGDRPTCPALRPHILSRTKYQAIKTAAESIANAFEKLVRHALNDPALLRVMGLTAAEEEMARMDPGYDRLCVTSRLDSYLTEEGFQFLEYNAESPAGVGDQMQLEKLLFGLPHMKQFLESHEHWAPQPHRELLRSLLTIYRDWGGQEEYPQIAIVDWNGVPTAGEFRILKTYFEESGFPAIIADPNELNYNEDRLNAGDFRIDILYKRVIIHEFLERSNLDHPLTRAYRDKRVCMANSFRSKVAHKKAGFAVLSDPQYAHLFSDQELEAIRRHIPWTRLVKRGQTTFDNVEHDLATLIRKERERFVLKPNDDYGGHGVFLGWETGTREWEQALTLALERPYVVQERAAVQKILMPMFSATVKLEEMFVDFNPFLFHNKVEGALIRLSTSSLLNVTSGGGQTALLVVED